MAANDAGPARYLAALAQHLDGAVTASGGIQGNTVFREARVPTIPLEHGARTASLIITGTCLGNGTDKQAIALSRKLDIPVVTVIEHWSWMDERFKDPTGAMLLPDLILVNDELAFDLACEAGLPSDLLVVVGNPYLEKLAGLRKRQRVSRIIKSERKFLFVSEDIFMNRQSGMLPDVDYDEYEVLKILLKVFRDESVRFTIKLHPREDPNKYLGIDQDLTVIASADLVSLADEFDLAIGMESMLLLELAALGMPTISFLPGSKREFIGQKLGATKCVQDVHLMKRLSLESHGMRTEFVEKFQDSGSRIAKLLQSKGM